MTTDENGEVSLSLPAQLQTTFLVAKADTLGLDYLFFNNNPSRVQKKLNPLEPGNYQFELTGCQKFTVTLVDKDNKPLPGIDVAPWLFRKPDLDETLNLPGIFNSTTNAEGVAEFNWIPEWNLNRAMTFWPRSDDYSGTRIDFYPDPENATPDLKATLFRLLPVE